MRLHRLRLTAFGPFAGEQDVDFDELSAAVLFLLHGPTGGGKTSVLDAVCYALYGQVPGGQAEYLRVPHADYGPIVVPDDGTPDDRWLFMSDILPTAWQAVQYADVPEGGTLAVLGLGPVGQFAARIGKHLGYRVLAVDPEQVRRDLGAEHGAEVFDLSDDLVPQLVDLTDGRGPDGVVDAVGMEAHGNPVAGFAQRAAGLLPDKLAQKAIETAGVDRLAAVHTAIDLVRRGGTVSLSGVYGGMADPMPMMTLFDKQITIREGQCNVKRWIDDIMPLVSDPADPLGTLDLTSHRVSLEDAPRMYSVFQKKQDDCVKVVLDPAMAAA